jgi:gas vesicle protein
MNDRTPFVTSFACFLAGGVVGAAAVMLWAPQSGRATRETIARTFGKTAGSARQIKDRVLQKGRQIQGEAAHRVSGAVSALSGRDGQAGPPDKSASV